MSSYNSILRTDVAQITTEGEAGLREKNVILLNVNDHIHTQLLSLKGCQSSLSLDTTNASSNTHTSHFDMSLNLQVCAHPTIKLRITITIVTSPMSKK